MVSSRTEMGASLYELFGSNILGERDELRAAEGGWPASWEPRGPSTSGAGGCARVDLRGRE